MLRLASLFLAFVLGLAAPVARAEGPNWSEDPAVNDFVANNVISTFYHELGHAMIDVLALPVLGREEDAADTLANLLMDGLWDEETSAQMIRDTARLYEIAILEADASVEDLAFDGVHSLDQVRYFNMVCLYYGGDVAAREEIALELGLPEDRAAGCEEEYWQADESWFGLLADYEGEGESLVLVAPEFEDPAVAVLQEQIDLLNGWYDLPETITVVIEPCGEVNAYYTPGEYLITMCTEYAEDSLRVAEEYGLDM